MILKDSEIVFVGYGIVAPEYGWNDYEGLDVHGKTVVMLVNDPGLTAATAEAIIEGTAVKIPGEVDEAQGAGIVDASAALTATP